MGERAFKPSETRPNSRRAEHAVIGMTACWSTHGDPLVFPVDDDLGQGLAQIDVPAQVHSRHRKRGVNPVDSQRPWPLGRTGE